MKFTYPTHQHRDIVKTLTQKDDVHFLAWVDVNSVLGKFWPERLTSTEYLVLTFVINRTLVFRKKAEVISKKHFLRGIQSSKGVTCAGAGVGETALSKALKTLCDKDFIHTHCFLDGHIESIPRIYELNVDVIVGGYDLGEVQNMLKRSRKALREEAENGPESDEKTPLTFAGGGGRDQGGITELLHSSISSSLRREEETTLKIGKHHADNCKERAKPVPARAQERLQQIQAEAASKRATRLHAVKGMPTRRWDIRDLQALLDEARARAGVTVPRIMATAKGAGVLFKRMKDAEIADALEFFTWTMTNWGTVANANRRSKAKQLRETQASSSEMSLIPNFQDLAYRLPYILVFYNERKFTGVQKVEAKAQERKESERKEGERQAAIAERREAVRQEDVRRLEQQQESDRRFRERVRRPARRVESDDEALPTYRERKWGEES